MTYVILSATVLAAIAVLTTPTLRELPPPPLLIAALVLIALTAVFDNIIVGLDLVAYDESKILGIRVPIAPIEDFAYTLGAVMLVPALWTWLARLGPVAGASASEGDS